jgi:hypothetical protein
MRRHTNIVAICFPDYLGLKSYLNIAVNKNRAFKMQLTNSTRKLYALSVTYRDLHKIFFNGQENLYPKLFYKTS